jgi:hypothetical protein
MAPMPWDFEGIVNGVFDRGKNKSEFQYLVTKLHTAQKDCIPPKPPWAVVDDLTVNTIGITCNSICVSFLVACIPELGKLAPCHKLLLSVDFLSTISKNSNGLIDKQPKPPWISYYEVVKPWMSEVFCASLKQMRRLLTVNVFGWVYEHQLLISNAISEGWLDKSKFLSQLFVLLPDVGLHIRETHVFSEFSVEFYLSFIAMAAIYSCLVLFKATWRNGFLPPLLVKIMIGTWSSWLSLLWLQLLTLILVWCSCHELMPELGIIHNYSVDLC